ncbi:aspartate-semialdehyde dehydrogenase [Candidatus Uhrbacteria bacterium]|nr:aspartate-semialdehyde dehydrogenase [Candidatus Uhrbacteria bacterium]
MSNKISVSILGATGSVGQKFIELLIDHPWFEIASLCASEKSTGKKYSEAANWFQPTPLPDYIGDMIVQSCEPSVKGRIAFSGLDSEVAGPIEERFASAGYAVISNSKNHRMDFDVPLLIPEVNAKQLELVRQQKFGSGMIVTNPNCSTVGLVMALKPLVDNFGVEEVSVVTMQALSGAGYPGVSSLDILDNVIPFISGEEAKMETEPLKILGVPIKISAQCNRVAVVDGHTESIAVKLSKSARVEEIIEAWKTFRAEPQTLQLPTAPAHPICYFKEDNFPQPRKHRMLEHGMVVSIGRLRPCPIMDWKFTVLSHNTIRGAAGGAILNAELLVKNGFIT